MKRLNRSEIETPHVYTLLALFDYSNFLIFLEQLVFSCIFDEKIIMIPNLRQHIVKF